MRCALCGFTFDAGDVPCSGCPLAGRCPLVCCPHCDYQNLEETRSATLRFLTKVGLRPPAARRHDGRR